MACAGKRASVRIKSIRLGSKECIGSCTRDVASQSVETHTTSILFCTLDVAGLSDETHTTFILLYYYSET